MVPDLEATLTSHSSLILLHGCVAHFAEAFMLNQTRDAQHMHHK